MILSRKNPADQQQFQEANNNNKKNGDNKHLVEGIYKQFQIRAIQKSDFDSVCQNISTYFIYDEITSKSLGIDGEYTKEFESIVRIVLEQDESFLAEDVETGEIAALRLNYTHHKNTNIFSTLQLKTRQIRIILQIFSELDQQAQIFETYPTINSYGFFFVASTTPKYRNQGLTKELYKRTLNYFKTNGLELAKVFTSSPFTKAATKSLNFEIVGRVDFKNLIDKETNEKVFVEEEEEEELTEEHYCLVKVLKL